MAEEPAAQAVTTLEETQAGSEDHSGVPCEGNSGVPDSGHDGAHLSEDSDMPSRVLEHMFDTDPWAVTWLMLSLPKLGSEDGSLRKSFMEFQYTHHLPSGQVRNITSIRLWKSTEGGGRQDVQFLGHKDRKWTQRHGTWCLNMDGSLAVEFRHNWPWVRTTVPHVFSWVVDDVEPHKLSFSFTKEEWGTYHKVTLARLEDPIMWAIDDTYWELTRPSV